MTGSSEAWWRVAVPHRDIREGRLDEAIFAAKLEDVAHGIAPSEYLDPETFFKRTYLTTGLANLIENVLSRIAGKGKGEAVIQIQTPFGGGKTHALLALYHILKNGKKVSQVQVVKDLLAKARIHEVPIAKVAVFVGTYADPLKGKTIWGDIAEQLGSYDLVKDHDVERVSPGKEIILKLLERNQPVLLLIDELLEYVVKAARVEMKHGSLKGQVLAFLQELTEAVSTTRNNALVVTLPSSTLERYDEAAEETWVQLQKVSGRVEAIYTPVEGEEVYEIIRKRLFDDLGDQGAPKLVAEEYFSLYQKLGEDVPSQAREARYREKIRKSYPFHPETIDVLFERWSTYPTFQRTRGVLRFLGEVVADLYKKEDPSPLIQPCNIDLSNPAIRRELVKHIGNEFEGVIASDVEGKDAKAPRIDREMGTEFSRFKVATCLARSIFFYSFSGAERRGVSVQRLRVAFLREGIPPSIVTEATRRLEEELWFLHNDRSLYYFMSQANLNRVVLDKEEGVRDEDVYQETRSRIDKLAGTDFDVYSWPISNSDIPDNKKLKLVLLPPKLPVGYKDPSKLVEDFLTRYSTAFRTYKNTVLFALLDSQEYDALNKAVRRYLSLDAISKDRDLMKTLSEENRQTLQQKYREADSSVTQRIISAYRHVAKGSKDGIRQFDLGIPTVGEKITLSRRVRQYLKDQELLLEKVSPKFVLERTFARTDQRKSFREIYEAFLKFPELPMLDSEYVLKTAIAQGVQTKSLGVLEGERFFFGDLMAPTSITDDSLILNHECASKLASEQAPSVTHTPVEGPSVQGVGLEAIENPSMTVFPGGLPKHLVIRAKVPWDKLSQLVGGVLTPLSRDGASITLQIEIDAQSATGIKRETVDLRILETLKQIGAEILEKREQ